MLIITQQTQPCNSHSSYSDYWDTISLNNDLLKCEKESIETHWKTEKVNTNLTRGLDWKDRGKKKFAYFAWRCAQGGG